jgi:dsRNA-specific ribonuclease
VFIPEVQSEDPKFQMAPNAGPSINGVEEVQSLTGYRFRNIAVLLQALTHPSCISHGSEESYQRLAFLGDAVLGFVVTKALFLHGNEISEGKMTEIKAAIVNSNMLGYVCMTHSISRNFVNIAAVAPNRFRNTTRKETKSLWKYMRHESQDLSKVQETCNTRYRRLYKML